MATVVFAPIYYGTVGVYQYDYLLAAAITPYTVSVTQTPEVSVSMTPVIITDRISASVVQRPEVSVTRQLQRAFAVTQTPTFGVVFDITLNDVATDVTQTPEVARVGFHELTFGVTQTPEITDSQTFVGGSEHSTFFVTGNVTQTPTFSKQVGLQISKYADVLVSVAAQLDVDRAGIIVYTPPDFGVAQVPTITSSMELIPMGKPQAVGWMLEPIAPESKPREPTTAELRKAARDEMQVAKRRAAAEARLAEEQRIRDAEAEVERVRGMLAQIDLLDAAVKPKYEQEIQALLEQQQAAIGEIMRLRAELMQAEQAQVQMSSRDKAVALLLSQ